MSARVPDRDAARTLVDQELNRDCAVPGDRLVVVDDETIEKPYGWVFFYQSGRFLETGELGFALAGNGPVVVLRADGSLHHLGCAEEPAASIERFEAQGLVRNHVTP
jgi:immunity protein 35 of polymorphic toxin system